MNDEVTNAPAAEQFEGLGTFYLGSILADPPEAGGPIPFLYDASDLTTHAVALGMTGSGKTGLCITLIEEAALDGIPTIAVDLKGDIANLLLTFPELAPNDFLPWIDETEAARSGRTPDEEAAAIAKSWREGLARSGQGGDRIRRLREAVDMAIYTPGATHGRPLAVLRSLAAPPEAMREDVDALGDRVTSAVSGLLTLVGLDDDPLKSREHILMSRILQDRWLAGTDLDLAGLIHAVQKPGFDRLGVLDLESFFPADDRFEFATRLNNLIAAPGFDAWLQGDPLDIGGLLWTATGKPRVSVVSVAHLDETERMFFLTMLLNEIVAWVRTRPGTGSLRALLYIDEVFGYLPPTAKPPTKPPLLTLLKQARAFGFGVVLATQNPVDLDYKALGNAGTWFLGRLQTERDKRRVLDGLEGVAAMSGSGGLQRSELDDLLSDLDKRVFLVNDVHEPAPVLIRTRWAMSYLRGPLARPEIARLTAGTPPGVRVDRPAPPPATRAGGTAGVRPMVPPKIDEVFVTAPGDTGPYRPALLGEAELHYIRRGSDLDHWTRVTCIAPLEDEWPKDPWDGSTLPDPPPELAADPMPDVGFLPLPAGGSDPSNWASLRGRLETWLYRERHLPLRRCERLELISTPDESEAEFAVRVRDAAREARDLAVRRIRESYAVKIERLQRQVETAEERVEREASQYERQRNQGLVRLGTSVLGAFLGRKKLSRTNLSKLSTTANTFGRAAKQKDDVGRAEDKVEALQEKLASLDADLEQELAGLREEWSPGALEIEVLAVAPRKSDIGVRRVALAWLRHRG